MSFISSPLPLDVWTRLLSRLDIEFDDKLDKLRALLRPKTATIDTATIVLTQSADARKQVFSELAYLERLQALILAVSSQVQLALFQAGIPDLDQKTSCLKKVVEMFETTMCGLHCREPIEQELSYVAEQYRLLRTAGHSDAINAERQRLAAGSREIPVVGAEDGARYESSARSLRSTLDELTSARQRLQASTLLAVQVSDSLAALLGPFGIELVAEPDPSQLAADTDTQGDAPNAGGDELVAPGPSPAETEASQPEAGVPAAEEAGPAQPA